MKIRRGLPVRGTRTGRSAPRVPFALLVVGLLVGGLVLLLVLNTASAANELRRHAVAVKDDQVAADVQQLRNDVAASAAPGNLARAAEQLGMVPAAAPAFIVKLPDGRLVLRGHPKAATQGPLPLPIGAPPTEKKPKPSTSPTTSKTSSTSRTPSATKSASTSTSKSAGKTRHAGRTSAAGRSTKRPASTTTKRARPTKSPTPTPTPTPTITLGGNR